MPEYQGLGVQVVGVRNAGGVKPGKAPAGVNLVVDEDDAVRNELEIPKDFFVLGGRESYVVDATGEIQAVHNNQFDPESHIAVTLDAAKELKTPSPLEGLFEGLKLPEFEMPKF